MLYHYAAVGQKPWYDMKMPNKRHYINYLKLSGYKEIKFKKTTVMSKIKGCKQTFLYHIKICFIRLFHLYHKGY